MADAFIQKPKQKSDVYARLLERRKTSEIKHVNRIRLPVWQFTPWEDSLRDSTVHRDDAKMQSCDCANVYTQRKCVASEDESVIRSLEKKKGDKNNQEQVKQRHLETKSKQKAKLKNELKVAQNALNHDKPRSQLKKELNTRVDKNVKPTSKPEKTSKSKGQSKSKIMARKIVKHAESRQTNITETTEKYSCELKSKENMSKNVRDAEMFDTEIFDSLEVVPQAVIGRNFDAVNKLYTSSKSALSNEIPVTGARSSKTRNYVGNLIKEDTKKSSSSKNITENTKTQSKTSKQNTGGGSKMKLTTPAETSQPESRETAVKRQRDKSSIESSKEGSSLGETKKGDQVDSGIEGNEEEIENTSEKDVEKYVKNARQEHHKSAKSINPSSMSNQAREPYDQPNSEENLPKAISNIRKKGKNGKSEEIPLHSTVNKNKVHDLKLAMSAENVEKKDWKITHSEASKDEGKTKTKTQRKSNLSAKASESDYHPEIEKNYLTEISNEKRVVNEKNGKSEEVFRATTVNGNKENDFQLVNNYMEEKYRKIGHHLDPLKDQVKAKIMTQCQDEVYRKRNEDKIRNFSDPGKMTQRENYGKRLISISPQSITAQGKKSDIEGKIPKEMLDTCRTGNEMHEKSEQISTETSVKKNKAYYLRRAISVEEHMAEKDMAIIHLNTTKTEARTPRQSNLLLKFTESIPDDFKNAIKDTILSKWLHGFICSHQEKAQTASYSLITDNYSIHILKKSLYTMETSSNEILKSFNWTDNTSVKENKAYALRWTMSTEKYMERCALKSLKVNAKTSDKTESYALETSETSASKHDKREKSLTTGKTVISLNRQLLQALLTETIFEENRGSKPKHVQNTLKSESLTRDLLELSKLQIVFNLKSVTGEDIALFVWLDGVPGSPLLLNFQKLCRSYSQLWGSKTYFQQIQSAQEDVAVARPDGYLPLLKMVKAKGDEEQSEETEDNSVSAVCSNGL